MGFGFGMGFQFGSRGGAFNPLTLFNNGEAGAFFVPQAGIPGTVIEALIDLSGNDDDASNTATETDYYRLRHDGGVRWSLQREGSAEFAVTLADLGSSATIAYVDGSSVTITGEQEISGSTTLPASDRLGPVLYIDRALTSGETQQLTAWLAARAPGNWLLGVGEWDDDGIWADHALWNDGVAA